MGTRQSRAMTNWTGSIPLALHFSISAGFMSRDHHADVGSLVDDGFGAVTESRLRRWRNSHRNGFAW